MFNFLKKKLKNAISSVKKKVEEEVEPSSVEETASVPVKEGIERIGEFEKVKTSSSKNSSKNSEKTKINIESKTNIKKKAKHKKSSAVSKKGILPSEIVSEKSDSRKKIISAAEAEILSDKGADVRGVVEKKQVAVEEGAEKRHIFKKIRGKIFGKKAAADVVEEESSAEPSAKKSAELIDKSVSVETSEKRYEKKSVFGKVGEAFTKKTLSESKFEDIFSDLELGLLESNVALEVIEKIKDDMKNVLVNQKIRRGKLEETIGASLRKSIDEILNQPNIDLLEEVHKKNPFVMCFFGINGSGKTTTITKLAYYLKSHGLSVVLAAADTFRAAAIDQLEQRAREIGVKVIKHDYGSDAAAVAFDAIQHAKAHNIDVVLIDTAGRTHSNKNLMDELKKIVRVSQPDMKVFVGDALTGNDMVEQAVHYDELLGIDSIMLAKTDADDKGGASISVSYITKKPILFLGIGQGYADIEKFDKNKILSLLGF